MLHDHFARPGRYLRVCQPGVQILQKSGAIQESVHVAGAGRLEAFHPLQPGHLFGYLLRDLAGRPPQNPGKFKGKWKGQVTQVDAGWGLDDEGIGRHLKIFLHKVTQMPSHPVDPIDKHRPMITQGWVEG